MAGQDELRNKRYIPHLPAGNKTLIKPELRDDLMARLEKVDVVVSCIGGNQHAVFGLLNHPRPYDFVLDAADPLIEGREIVPVSVVRAAMREQMSRMIIFFPSCGARSTSR